MKTKLLLLFLFFSLLGNAQINKDHLIPMLSESEMSDEQHEYYINVRTVLLRGLSDEPLIRYRVQYPFETECVLDIEYSESNDNFYLIYRTCKENIWGNENWTYVEFEEYERKIDPYSVAIIHSLFLSILKQTRYNDKYIFADESVDHHFYAWSEDFGLMSGMASSPSRYGDIIKEFASICNTLIGFSKGGDSVISFDEMLQYRISKLQMKLYFSITENEMENLIYRLEIED